MSKFKERLLALTSLRYEMLPELLHQMSLAARGKSNDPILLILRCHLLTEVVLERLLDLCLEPNGTAVLSANLRYIQKLDIASQCMLVDDFELIPQSVVASLKKLNKLRNRLSHNLNVTITYKDALELFQGIELPIMDITNKDVPIIIWHYTSTIFGNMLPNYEAVE